MRILHVGSGFRPWRQGGLVAYTEDLMDEQARREHDVAYFFSGRQYPLARGPWLHRWKRNRVAMLEIVNSPLYDHGRQPDLEVTEPTIERMFEDLLEELRPEVVHVQELAGLPSAVVELARVAGIPTVVTLQDYFPLCPAFKLLDADGRVCLRRDVGADCVATIAAQTRRSGLLIEATIAYHLMRVRAMRGPAGGRRAAFVHNVARVAGNAEASRRRRRGGGEVSAANFQSRREMNVERLNRADCVIAMSERVAEIYFELGVDRNRIGTVQHTLAHVEHLRPRYGKPGAPLTFATLGAFESEAKGGHALIEAMRLLQGRIPDQQFRLLVFGHVDPRLEALAGGVPRLELAGGFAAPQLDLILDQVDVGLMPSIWEEAYGYAGIEFLAKGIPVIANAIGGMTDYVRDGETGWLNRSRSSEELAGIMAGLIEHPDQVSHLSAKVISNREAILKPLGRHAEEIDIVYRAAGRACGGG